MPIHGRIRDFQWQGGEVELFLFWLFFSSLNDVLLLVKEELPLSEHSVTETLSTLARLV